MKKLIICLTNDIVYDRRILRTIDALKDHFEIEVFCRKIHTQTTDIKGVKIIRFKCYFNRGFLFYAEYSLRLLLKLLSTKFEILLSVDYDTIMPCALASRLKRGKLVFDAHEYFEESVEIVSRKWVKKWWSWIGKTYVSYSDAAYTVSSSIASRYQIIHGIDFATIRNVPSLTSQEPIPTIKHVILYQGVLNEGRELDQLIESGQYLDDDYDIWILGEGDISKELKASAGDHITFFGWVQPEDLSTYTIKADLAYNLLSSTSRSYYYSLANKFFDYLHGGVPSLNNTFPEYVRINERYNCCYTEDIDNSSSLAAFFIKTIADKAGLEEKRKNARLAAADLCWEKESKKLLELFSKL